MAPQKKAAGKAADGRNGHVSSSLVLLPGGRESLPVMPTGWTNTTAASWDAYWTDTVAGLIQPSEVAIVCRYFEYVDEWNRTMRAFKAQRLVEGSTGQPRLNPLAGFLRELEGVMSALEMRLGLSPKARAQLGIVLGEAKRSLADLNNDLGGNDHSDEDSQDDPRD